MAAATAADAKMDFMICEQNETLGDTRHWIGALDTEAMKKAGVTVQKDRLLNEDCPLCFLQMRYGSHQDVDEQQC